MRYWHASGHNHTPFLPFVSMPPYAPSRLRGLVMSHLSLGQHLSGLFRPDFPSIPYRQSAQDSGSQALFLAVAAPMRSSWSHCQCHLVILWRMLVQRVLQRLYSWKRVQCKHMKENRRRSCLWPSQACTSMKQKTANTYAYHNWKLMSLFRCCSFCLQLEGSCLQLSFVAYSCVRELYYLQWQLEPFCLWLELFCLQLKSWSLCAYNGKVRLISILMDCKQKKAQVWARKLQLQVKKLPLCWFFWKVDCRVFSLSASGVWTSSSHGPRSFSMPFYATGAGWQFVPPTVVCYEILSQNLAAELKRFLMSTWCHIGHTVPVITTSTEFFHKRPQGISCRHCENHTLAHWSQVGLLSQS